MSHTPKPTPDRKPSMEEKRAAAKAWARFLYDEYMLEKHKQLLSKDNHKKMDTS